MKVNYIWIGTQEVPSKYISNLQKCASLNPNFQFQVWRNEECINLLQENNLFDYWTTLSFICKCNLLKYLILDKFGGIYTDFDIAWKVPFIKILNDFNFANVDLIATILDSNPIIVGNQPINLVDDPFLASKSNILGNCIEYCKNRTDLKYDGEIYLSTKELKTHKTEPIGPFGLTEWILNSNIKVSTFTQSTLLDHNGFFGVHDQKMNWKNIY